MVILNEGAMAKTLPISEVKARLPELVAGVMEREEEIVVTRNGRPAAGAGECRGVRAPQGNA